MRGLRGLRMRILYVDDDPDDQDIFCEIARKIKPTITCYLANGGNEALKLLKSLSEMPDYIFLDINMPGMTGLEFLIEKKKDERLRNVPVVMYSTSYTETIANDCKNLGAQDLLLKGNRMSEVEQALSKYLR